VIVLRAACPRDSTCANLRLDSASVRSSGRFIGHSSSDIPEAKESLLRRSAAINEEESRSRVSLFARSRCLSQEINVRPTKLADRRESNGDTVLRIILTSRVREKKREMAMLVPFLREMRKLLSSYRIAQSSKFRVQSVEPDIYRQAYLFIY